MTIDSEISNLFSPDIIRVDYERPRLVHVSTVPEFLWSFFQGQVEYTVANGFDVHLVCSQGDLINELRAWPAHVHTIEMARAISPFQDLLAIRKMATLFNNISPNIVHAHTSKAGLIAMIAAKITGVPISIFTIHGFRWVGKKGLSRLLIKTANRLTCRLADKVCCVSHSNLDVGISENICSLEKTNVLCSGSVNGVDSLNRFNPANYQGRKTLRSELGIKDQDIVFGFVGRIVRDKGIDEISVAWKEIREEYNDTHLIMVGKMESGDPVPEETIDNLKSDPRVHFLGFQRDIPKYLNMMDVLLLPSYREGFPVTPLEASAMELPVIATRIPGCVDAVVDGVTGILINPRSSKELSEAMWKLLNDKNLMKRLGRNGRQYVMEYFQPEKIWEALLYEYNKLLKLRSEQSYKKKSLGLIFKRTMDFSLAGIGMILTSPLFLTVSFLTYMSLGNPIFYKDKRAGKAGKPFWFYKFRTMTNERDQDGNLLPDNERLTILGRLIRAASLDELPQLVNVIKGEMSLVGPRPLPIKYMKLYNSKQALRHKMKPGITGWVAVNYRGKSKTWEEKLNQDVWYVENWSLGLDFKILFLTVIVLFRRLIINRRGETTSEEFTGAKGGEQRV